MFRPLLPLLASLVMSASVVFAAEPPKVVATIKPIHSLAAALMDGIGEPQLLIDGAGSPHGFHLKPSQRRMLSESDLFIWVGDALEFFVTRLIADLDQRTRVVKLLDLDGLAHLPTRPAGVLSDAAIHSHGDADAKHVDLDPHIWLNPANAARIASELAGVLATMDPANAARYRDNNAKLQRDIAALDTLLAARIRPLQDLTYVAFHDAFQHFETHFGIRPAAIVSVHPEQPPGAKRVAAIRNAIVTRDIECIFIEPQFPPKLLLTLVDGTETRVGTLDPLGAGVTSGAGAWFELMSRIVDSLSACNQ